MSSTPTVIFQRNLNSELISPENVLLSMINKPMLPTLIKEPFDHPDWIFEIKWDGYRVMTQIQNGKICMMSKNGREFTRFSQICNSLFEINYDVVLDGEIVVLDQDGKPNFSKLMFSRKNQLTYYAFDILSLKGKSLMRLPLIRRKEILKDLLPETPQVRFSGHVEGQGIGLFELAKHNNLEGIVAKLKSSTYTEGKSRNWLKIKTWDKKEYERRSEIFKKL